MAEYILGHLIMPEYEEDWAQRTALQAADHICWIARARLVPSGEEDGKYTIVGRSHHGRCWPHIVYDAIEQAVELAAQRLDPVMSDDALDTAIYLCAEEAAWEVWDENDPDRYDDDPFEQC